MAAAAIVKNKKSPYFSRGSSDFDEIWNSDAVLPSWPFWPLKFKILKIEDGGSSVYKLQFFYIYSLYICVKLGLC